MVQVHEPAVRKLVKTVADHKAKLTLLEKKVSVVQSVVGTVGTTITFDTVAPGGPHSTGDIWYFTDAFGNILNTYQWNGSSWVPYVLSTGGIANGAVTNALLAAGSVGNSNVQTSAIGQSNLQSSSVGAVNLQSYAVGAGLAMSQYSGQNMIVDGQFGSSAITAARLADSATTGTWSLSNAPIGSPFTVGHNSSASATSLTTSVSTAVPSGSAILVSVLLPASATWSIGDSQGNTYALVSTQVTAGSAQLIFGCPTSKALGLTDTITATASGSATKILVVAYGVPLGYGFDNPAGFHGGTSTVSFTTKANSMPGDVNIIFFNNIDGLVISGGGGAPAGWTYGGGSTSGGVNYVTEICWEYAPNTAGQAITTSYPSTPTHQWLCTSIGITNSGASGHMGVTGTTTAAILPLMPSSSTPAPAMYVNPGEQYYLSMLVNVPGAVTAKTGIQLVTDAGTLTVSGINTGFQTLAGTVTIPPGARQAYVRVFATASSGTISGISMVNPSAALSQLTGSSWTLNDSGLKVTEPGAPTGPYVQVHVNTAANAPAIDLATNLASEQGNPALYVNGQSVGTGIEYETLWLAGPAAAVDGNSVAIVMSSTTKDGTTAQANGSLDFNSTSILSWNSSVVNISTGIDAASIHVSGTGQFDNAVNVGSGGVSCTGGGGYSGASIHVTGAGQVDGGLTVGSGVAVTSGGYTGASIHTTGAGQFDGGITGSLGISGFASIHVTGVAQADSGFTSAAGVNSASIHTTGAGQFDGGISYTGGSTGGSFHVSGNGQVDGTLTVGSGGITSSAGGASIASIHTTGAGQFDGGITYTGGCNGSSVHTSGVVKADAGFQGPAIGGFPVTTSTVIATVSGSNCVLTTGGAALLNNINAALT